MTIAKHVIFVLIEEKKNKYGLIGLQLWFYDIYIKIYELSRGQRFPQKSYSAIKT